MLNNTVLLRKRHLAVAVSGALALFASLPSSASTLRIAMTAADIPLTLGQPDQGYEGNRFTGIPLYDALVEWDLSQGEKPSGLVPGLATEWHVDPQNQRRWIFTLRPGVKFHDGSEVNADAIVWNVDKVLNKTAPQYAPGQIGNTLSRMPTLSGAEKIERYTLALTTSGQMQPLPMNEYIQQSLKSCFFNVDIKVTEWNTLFTNWRLGAKDPSAKGIDAINVSAAVNDPYFGLIRFSTAKAFPPVATNWGYFATPETERLATAVKHAFTPAEMDKAAGELHAALVDQVPFLFVAHDVGPRAISPAVTGVVQPQSWFIDLSLVSKKE